MEYNAINMECIRSNYYALLPEELEMRTKLNVISRHIERYQMLLTLTIYKSTSILCNTNTITFCKDISIFLLCKYLVVNLLDCKYC